MRVEVPAGASVSSQTTWGVLGSWLTPSPLGLTAGCGTLPQVLFTVPPAWRGALERASSTPSEPLLTETQTWLEEGTRFPSPFPVSSFPA